MFQSWGWQSAEARTPRLFLTAAAPAAAAALWGLFAAQKARIPAPLAGVLAVKALVFGAAVAALYAMGRHGWATASPSWSWPTPSWPPWTGRPCRAGRPDGPPSLESDSIGYCHRQVIKVDEDVMLGRWYTAFGINVLLGGPAIIPIWTLYYIGATWAHPAPEANDGLGVVFVGFGLIVAVCGFLWWMVNRPFARRTQLSSPQYWALSLLGAFAPSLALLFLNP